MITKIKFISMIRHISWCSYQIGVNQEYNEKINDDQLESLIAGVKFMLDNPNITPEQSHSNWMKMKVSQGWVYGKVKDFEKKTHPNLIPYKELPIIEKDKDFVGDVSHRMALKLWNEINDH